MNRFVAGVVAMALLLMVTIEARPVPGKSASADNMQGSYRFERNGWIYVHVEGPPERMGYQHGYLLAREIGDLLSVIKPMWMHMTDRDVDSIQRCHEAGG